MSPSSAALLAVACVVYIASVSAMPLQGGSTCAILSGSLPQFCACTDGSDFSATLVCSINPMSLDQMSFTGVVQPCNTSGATIDLSVKDTKFNVSYAFPQFAANTNGSVPVPGECSYNRAPDFCSPALIRPLSQTFLSPLPSVAPVFTPTTTSAATHPPSPSALLLTFVSFPPFTPPARASSAFQECLSRS